MLNSSVPSVSLLKKIYLRYQARMAKIAHDYLFCTRMIGILLICFGVMVSIIAAVFLTLSGLTVYNGSGIFDEGSQSASYTLSVWSLPLVSIFICSYVVQWWHIGSIVYYAYSKCCTFIMLACFCLAFFYFNVVGS